jgi:hypothetical protein
MSAGQRVAVRFALLACMLIAAPLRLAAQAPAVPLYEHVRTHIDPTTARLRPEAQQLPDEPVGRRFARLRSGPGSLEGLGSRHIEWDGTEKAVRTVYLLEQIAEGNAAAEPVLYELLRTDDVVTFYNEALDYAASRIPSAEPELHALARRLATTATDRGPVKFGIAMLGAIGDPRDVSIVQTLALHDEFGLYAAEALMELAPERQSALFEMARNVTGWGRIEAVSRMVATTDPTLRRWLLTEGFRNTVTPQYVAYQCATIADLAGALADMPGGRKADVPLLIGAAQLIQAMANPGPGTGLDEYADAPQVAETFLRHILGRHDSVSFYLAADALAQHVASLPATAELADADSPSASARAEETSRGTPSTAAQSESSASSGTRTTSSLFHREPVRRVTWTAAQRQVVADLSKRVISDRKWPRRLVAEIASDETDLDQAEAAAKKLGIRTHELHVKQLTKGSINPRRWEIALAVADARETQRLVDIAGHTFEPRLQHTRRASPNRSNGAAHDDGTGGTTLEAVLRAASRYPGSALGLVEPCLTDEDPRVRRAAVETLIAWGGAYLRSVSVRAALNEAARTEQDLALKARIVSLLSLDTLP